MSSDGRPVDRQAWLAGAAGGLATALLTNLVASEFELVAWLAVVVAAVAYAVYRFRPKPYVVETLLYVTAGGVALTFVVPTSWAGPMTVALLVLAICAAVGAWDRTAAFTSLGGIGIFTASLIGVAEALGGRTIFGRILLVGACVCFALLGLFWVRFRRDVFSSRGLTVEQLRNYRMWWSRAGTMGLLAVGFGVQDFGRGQVLSGVLAGLAGLSWLVLTMTFVFGGTGEVLIGAMLAVSGAALSGLGLIGFAGQEFRGGMVGVTLGVAMVGGGLSLLHAAGALRRLRGALFES